jgi:ribosomal protein S27AE
MGSDTDSGDFAVLSPDEAFAVLGEKARLQILQTLGNADEPLAYSELFARVEYDDSSNFHYHLNKLLDHFIDKTVTGYVLQQAGRRVVEAILSGAVTDDPVVEPTTVDKTCTVCSAPVKLAYHQERVKLHCPECDGVVSESRLEGDRFVTFGNQGFIPLPPAGVQGRTATEVLHAAELWVATNMRAAAKGICPRCSATVEHSISVCETHEATDGRCDECGVRFEATVRLTCTNCIFDEGLYLPAFLAIHPELVGFMIKHGIDPYSPEGFDFPMAAVDEMVLSKDPFEARYTFTADDDTLALTVDGDLSVIGVTRNPNPETNY